MKELSDKNMEEEIRREKNNLNNVLEALPTSILTTDSNTVIKWANKSARSMFDKIGQNIIGYPIGVATHCINSLEKGCGAGMKCRFCGIRNAINKVLNEGIPGKDIIIPHTTIYDSKERKYWFRINFIPFEAADENLTIVAIDDITEQIEYEEALRKSKEDAVAANKVKSEFLANMSHEIRTPLNGILGMMELLLLSGLNEEQLENVSLAKYSATALLKVINDILDFSKMESGKLLIHNITFNLKLMVEELIKIHTILANNKGLQFIYELSPSIPEYLEGDPDRIRQILNNLIANAIKFTPAGQIKLTISIKDMTDNTIDLKFNVIDTGIGIPEDKIDQLFQRFSQVDGSITREYGGSGLGLVICKQLVNMMHGEIGVKSQIGKGSTFYFTIRFNLNKLDNYSIQSADNEEHYQINNFIDTQKKFDSKLKYNRVKLNENGEIELIESIEDTFHKEMINELEELGQLIDNLEINIRENKIFLVEQNSNNIRKLAIQLNAFDLGDLAFKLELAARKCNWDNVKRLSGNVKTEFSRLKNL
jgi:Signal transduction histidine kinase